MWLFSAVLLSERDFVVIAWSIFLVIKAKQDQSSCFFHLIYCVNDFRDEFLQRIEVIRQI